MATSEYKGSVNYKPGQFASIFKKDLPLNQDIDGREEKTQRGEASKTEQESTGSSKESD